MNVIDYRKGVRKPVRTAVNSSHSLKQVAYWIAEGVLFLGYGYVIGLMVNRV